MPRVATSTDLDGVLSLAAGKDYPTWPSQDPQQNGQPFLEDLRESTRWPTDFELLVTEDREGLTGFVVLEKQSVRSLTGDRESVIRDSFALRASQQRELLEHAAEAARNRWALAKSTTPLGYLPGPSQLLCKTLQSHQIQETLFHAPLKVLENEGSVNISFVQLDNGQPGRSWPLVD